MNIIDALDHEHIFGPVFKDDGTWAAWRAFLCVVFGITLDKDARDLATRCTKRTSLNENSYSESWLVVGRRGGKSRVLALIAVFLACFKNWSPHLAPGEVATVMVIAADRKQARTIMRYAQGLLTAIPPLKELVLSKSQESIELSNRVVIEVHTASFRAVRGYTIAAALLDEVAFWRTDDAANPDFEILAAIRPALASLPHSMLLAASSPYAKRGALFDAYKNHFGHDTPVLVWQADTATMNPSIDQKIIDDAYERDPEAAQAEYGASFRSDIATFLPRNVVETCVTADCHERPHDPQFQYVAFTDPSGGSQDSFTLAIAHMEGANIVLDAIRETRPPFSPDNVVQQYADLIKAYGLNRVHGDRYAGEWPRERFRERSITYEPSERSKSDLYRDFLPVLTTGRADLLDHPLLLHQLTALERRTSRSGRDSIDHPPGYHDDIANAVAGACVLADRPIGIAPRNIQLRLYA